MLQLRFAKLFLLVSVLCELSGPPRCAIIAAILIAMQMDRMLTPTFMINPHAAFACPGGPCGTGARPLDWQDRAQRKGLP